MIGSNFSGTYWRKKKDTQHILFGQDYHVGCPCYCWWTKSCTTKDDDYPIFCRVLTIPGGAGFLPSTVCRCISLDFSVEIWGPWKNLDCITQPYGNIYLEPEAGAPLFLLQKKGLVLEGVLTFKNRGKSWVPDIFTWTFQRVPNGF